MRTPRNPKKHSRKLRIPKRRFTVEKLEPRNLLATGFGILDIAKIETNTTVWTSMASADLLKDGASDVVLGGWIEDSSYQVAMHQKGVGAITLKDRTFVPTNSSLTGTGVGDANDDGIIDILLGNNWNSGSPNVLPLLGDGAGGFQRSTSRSNGGFFTPTYVSTFDFDGDGRNELVTSNYNDDSLSVISPTGNSTRIPLSPDYGANGGNHLIVDVNKDGAADLVSAVGDPDGTSTPGLAIAKGNGTGGFGSTEFLVRPGAWGQVYADYVDLNNDQAPEILVADSLQGAVRLYMNDGFGNFTSVSDLITEPNIKRIHVLNRPTATDSTICIATVSATDGVKLFFRNEGGNWEKSGDFPVAAKMSSVGDFDGDGTLDIVALDSRGTLTFAYLTRNRTPTISDSLRPDNSFGENNQIRVSGVWPRLHRLSGGRFAITSTGSSQEDSFGVTIDVFNANGKPDLTFGANGRTIINPRGEKSAARGLWELKDGSLLVVGDPNYGYGQDDWAVFKIKKSGTLDSSFGSGGIINLDVPGFGLIDSVAVDTFDRILITGKLLNSSVLGVARLQSNGSIDPTFGTAGWRQVDLGNSLDNSVAYSKVLPGTDGTFFVKTGREYQAAQPRQTILLKFDADGDVINDLRLGLGQEVRSDDAVIDSQGRILVVGTVNTDVFLVRYDSSGNLDASFGANGLVNRKSVTFQSAGTGICLDGNNRIYVAYLSKDSQSVHIERFLSDGTADREFGILGTFSIQFNEILGGDSQWLDLLRTDDGGLLIGSPNSNWNSYVKRFLPDWDTLNLNEDSDSYTVSLTGISAGSGENQPLKITASSSNSLVISNVDVSYTSPDPVGSLKFKPATNSYGSSEIAVTVEDGGLDGLISTPNDNKSIRRSLTVNIISVNDPPVLPVFDDIIISEDSPEQTIEFDGVNAGPFESQPIHLNLRSINLGLIPAPHLSFQPSAGRGTIRFKPTANLNGQSIVNVDLTDGGNDNDLETTQDNLSFTRSFTITVLPVNDAPTDIYLTPYSVPENAAANSTIGTLRTTDPDDGNTFTYKLIQGDGDNDNGNFRISGATLRAIPSFDFEAKSSYTIRVESTDQSGLSTQKSLLISVIDVNEAPQFKEPNYEFEVATGSKQGQGDQANNGQWRPSISRDGRFIAFVSYATNLADNDNTLDIFVRDTHSGNIIEASNTSAGDRSNGDSFNPSLTPDGRFVVFESYASNLVPEDSGSTGDVFLRDLQTGSIVRVSTSGTGVEGNARSYSPTISDDGRYIVFRSDASNLVEGDSNLKGDIFVKDMLTGALRRISIAIDGTQGNDHSFEPAISGDGNFVGFRSYASNIVPGGDITLENLYVTNLRTGEIHRANANSIELQGLNTSWIPSLNNDGRFICFPSTANTLVPGDTNSKWDVFIKDMLTGIMTRVSTANDESQGNGDSKYATISDDGRYVTFLSHSSNLAPDDTNGKADIFVKDSLTGSIMRASTTSDLNQANDASEELFTNKTGKFVAFTSSATNLVASDSNGVSDIFLKDLGTGQTTLAVRSNTSVLIGQATGVDQDMNSALLYTLTGTGTDAFVIDPRTGQIALSPTGVMDFQLQPTYSISVSVSDGVLSDTAGVTIHVTNGNNRPSDILLSSSAIEENLAANTLIGSFHVTDPNPGDTHTYQLVEGLGSTDNSAFSIAGRSLYAIHSFDFENKSSYSLRIRATDQGGLYREEIFTIRVIDIDEGFPLPGTTGNDSFVATYTGDSVNHSWSVTRNGISVFNGPIPGNLFLMLDGLGGTDTLDVIGRSLNDSFSLDGGQLFVNGAKLRFPGVETVRVQAKEGNDSMMVLAPLSQGITGRFDGGAGIDKIGCIAGDNTWNITGTDTGSVNGIFVFVSTESLQGGLNSDQFVFNAIGKVTGQILGGDGRDTANFTAKTSPHTINLENNTATSTGGIRGIETFISSSITTIVDVIIGANSDTNWTISGMNSGTLTCSVTGPVSFVGFESLTGGTASDVFVFSNNGTVSKNLTGGTANGVRDTVDLSEKISAIEFRLNGSATSVPGVIGAYVGIETLKGNNHTNTKVVRTSNTVTNWSIDASGNIAALGALYSSVPMITGGPSLDILTGPSISNSTVAWVIDGANGGTITIPSLRTITFTSVDGLSGGTGNDTFEIRPTGSLSANLNGGTGTGINSLSYEQWSTNVAVNLSVNSVANATAIAGSTTNLQIVTGGSGNDSLRGNATKSTVLIGLGGNDTIVGGSQRDLLFGGIGGDLMQGGSGDDLLVSARTAYDTNHQAILGLFAEWMTVRTFAQRTANLWGNGNGTRSNSNYFLNSNSADPIVDTVFADDENDSLSGGLNQDWFFASVNDLTDFTGMGPTPDRLDS